ncbi:MAG: FAD-dependent oxidoreductase, partial [Candidatus Sericytochromatia bacterium]
MQAGSPESPLRVAIIGSGPSGFYAAEALFKSPLEVRVDMFEKLPVPFGLVRSGVAPDHPKIKNVTRVYDKLANDPRFRFWGNVSVGEDVQVDELRRHFHALIFTNGAASDRRLGIPGEDLARSYTATEFVAWYNGHPEYRDHSFDLSQETAVIIGQGNVAVDVCRILAKSVDELKNTDIARHALEALAESKIKDIYMVGRRGPAQAAFTPQEAKELGELAICDSIVKLEDLKLSAVDEAELQLPDK